MSRWIEQSITEYTGVTDAADVAAIMDVMANHCRTFSGLSLERFAKEAREAAQFVAYMKTPEGQAEEQAYLAQWAA